MQIFTLPLNPSVCRSQPLLAKQGRFPVARRQRHYHQIEKQLILSFWWMLRWCPDSSTVRAAELECEKLISSWPKVLLVTPGYRENDMSHCVSRASSSRGLRTVKPTNNKKCMQNACFTLVVLESNSGFPEKGVGKLQNAVVTKSTFNQQPPGEEMQTSFWTPAGEPTENKAVPAQENPFLGDLEMIWRVFCGFFL